MADLLGDMHQLKIRIGAHEFLFLALIARLMQRDPELAQAARYWIDDHFGRHSTSELSAVTDPQVLSAIRKHYLLILKEAEEQERPAAAVPKSKSIRRRMFEWFERA
jgi:hypothetical protein